MSYRSRRDDRGQILPLVLLLIALGAGLAVLVGEFEAVAVERARARATATADAAALAAATERDDGRTVAREFAAPNGAQLMSFTRDGGEVLVVVRVGRARATARAVAVLCGPGDPCGRFSGP
jgi:Flp pilus assembly protein TadG